MTDDPTQNNPPSNNSGENLGDGPPKKRRRRRRRNKNKNGQGQAPQDQASSDPTVNADGVPRGENAPPPVEKQAPANATQPQAGSGYRGKSDGPRDAEAADKPRADRADPKPQRDRDEKPDARPESKSSGGPTNRPSKSNNNNNNADQDRNARKRRKPRTKQCVHCFTPCTTIHRVRLDFRKQWVFICDICWPSRCIDNPHYEYGGMWVSGRIVKPESQLRDEWLARQNNHKPRPAHDNIKPITPSPANEKTNISPTAVAEENPESNNE